MSRTCVVIAAAYGGLLTGKVLGVGPDPILPELRRLGIDWEMVERDDPRFVDAVERHVAKGGDTVLRVVEIPSEIDWMICAYDGHEYVAEKHRRWDQEGEVTWGSGASAGAFRT